MLEKIRTYFYEREKRRRLSGAAGRTSQYKKDRKNYFGLLLDAGNTGHRDEVVAFADQLRKEGHRVRILGFLEGKGEGVSMPFEIFTSADLAKLTAVPKGELIEGFIAQPFDVLVNMSIHRDHRALDYISSLSKATFRIGPWYPQSRHNPYDLCLDAGSTVTLKDWIRELMHTLQKIY